MKWIGGVAATLVGVVALYLIMYPSLTLRYRLSLEAEVDDKPMIGSSVVEVTYRMQPEIGSGRNLVRSYKGEAVVLHLGTRGTLFALLRAGDDIRSSPESIILRAYGFQGSLIDGGMQHLRQLSGKRDLPLTSLPMLVRFRDPNDMRSVESVDPLKIESKFGAGTKLVRATLEMVPQGMWPLNLLGITGEPITEDIESSLPWWNGPFPWLKPLGGGVYQDTRDDAFKVSKEDFKYPPKRQGE
ncbi:hypothetical protein C2U70_18815 [Bradyrhizobium guangdongense]|uniref:hypothetical protein n=1 Tax=Bradyrhizobium guangdongense TaxID=1325090 RepID=UPI001126B0F1|nr:hypothetical protein [Bradyrhizobium guangdongense]TPQ33681.1 hypothetical protein C2U70_18815 [Bradyrhizobium guangdongense]